MHFTELPLGFRAKIDNLEKALPRIGPRLLGCPVRQSPFLSFETDHNTVIVRRTAWKLTQNTVHNIPKLHLEASYLRAVSTSC
jgi:hypothetical protein